MSIKSAVTPTIPYVAPTKKKLLLYVARAVEKREHTQKQKTLVALLFSLVMTASRLTAASSGFKIQNKGHATLSESNQSKKTSTIRQKLPLIDLVCCECCKHYPPPLISKASLLENDHKMN